MKAMILAAGLGTRLRPLTDKKPKALMPVANMPIIDRVIGYLIDHGVTRIIVNAHHHSRQILDHLQGDRPFGIEIETRVEPEILGTGGGIKNTADFWDDAPFIVMNSDILTDIDLSRAYGYHQESGAPATLVLHDCDPYNQIQTDGHHHITEISSSQGPGRLAFTGIHILDPAILSFIPDTGFSNIIDCYRELISSGEPVKGFLSEGHYWHDIGTVAGYTEANRRLLGLLQNSFLVGPGGRLDASVRLEDWAIVGENAHLERDVEIRRSILWEGVKVEKGVRIIDSIVTSFREVKQDLNGQIT
jgi:NDP-sugar pyrophosphorylase family protein